jgi:hypothetical protein
VTFEARAGFAGATFEGDIGFDEATFMGQAVFFGVTFELARDFGPVLVRRQLNFMAATFKQRVEIQAAAATLCACRARFPTGVQLRLRWAQVMLEDADLVAPSILAGVPPFPELNEDRFTRAWRRLPPTRGRDGRPRLLSLESTYSPKECDSHPAMAKRPHTAFEADRWGLQSTAKVEIT